MNGSVHLQIVGPSVAVCVFTVYTTHAFLYTYIIGQVIQSDLIVVNCGNYGKVLKAILLCFTETGPNFHYTTEYEWSHMKNSGKSINTLKLNVIKQTFKRLTYSKNH